MIKQTIILDSVLGAELLASNIEDVFSKAHNAEDIILKAAEQAKTLIKIYEGAWDLVAHKSEQQVSELLQTEILQKYQNFVTIASYKYSRAETLKAIYTQNNIAVGQDIGELVNIDPMTLREGVILFYLLEHYRVKYAGDYVEDAEVVHMINVVIEILEKGAIGAMFEPYEVQEFTPRVQQYLITADVQA